MLRTVIHLVRLIIFLTTSKSKMGEKISSFSLLYVLLLLDIKHYMTHTHSHHTIHTHTTTYMSPTDSVRAFLSSYFQLWENVVCLLKARCLCPTFMIIFFHIFFQIFFPDTFTHTDFFLFEIFLSFR